MVFANKCKEHTQAKNYKPIYQKPSHNLFLINKRRLEDPITGQLTLLLKHGTIIRTEKSSHRRCSIRKSCSQNFCNIHRKTHERTNVLNELHFLCNENVLTYTISYNRLLSQYLGKNIQSFSTSPERSWLQCSSINILTWLLTRRETLSLGAGCRSSHQMLFLRKGVLKICSKATLLKSHFDMGVLL